MASLNVAADGEDAGTTGVGITCSANENKKNYKHYRIGKNIYQRE
jgi:hypothetical protein